MDASPISSSAAAPADAPAAAPLGHPDQRALRRRYKEAGRPAGVYAIRNLANGRILVGASPDVEGALNRHRFELDLKSHRNRALLEDWLRFEPGNFRFEVVDTVKPRDDAAFDAAAELAGLLALWTEELDAGAERGYRAGPRVASTGAAVGGGA